MDRIFGLCTPRADILSGALHESEFAADLAQVLNGSAPSEYRVPALFFANTYPTRGLRELVRNVLLRLDGHAEQVGAIFRLDTQFGGGKTHALIALSHAAQGMNGVTNAAEFLDPALLPAVPVRIAAFDGENADPANGRRMEDGIRAHTPWGEIACQLGGAEGYRTLQRSDEEGVAPGADTLKELFGGNPCLILLDELALYLRKASASRRQQAAQQLSAFLTSLFKAVEATPKVALVFTLAIGKEGKATDAYAQENQQVAAFMAEAASVSARKAALLDPTEDDETVKVLCRRLFASIDRERASAVIDAYLQGWQQHQDKLPKELGEQRQERRQQFIDGYPLHPELMQTLTEKTATLENFQRVRGMLRLLARTVARLWETRPGDAHAIHLHHLDPGYEPIRHEITVRMEQRALVPAIKAEIAALPGEPPALSGEIDRQHYLGQPPYGSYVARTILWHTLAWPQSLTGLTPDRLRYAILSPGCDISFIDDARKRFVAESAYLDDRPNEPLRLLHTPNLTQMIRRQEQQVDPAEVRTQLNDRIRRLFGGATLNLIPFAAGPHDVPEDNGDGKPYLVLLNHEACSLDFERIEIPPLAASIWKHKGNGADFRQSRNNLVFLMADALHTETMRQRMVRRLALEAMLAPDKLEALADYQRSKVREYHNVSERDLAVAIQQAYRHLFYPSRARLPSSDCDLAHTVIDAQQAAEKPGDGQRQVVNQLQQVNKLRLPNDNPDTPAYTRDRTPLKKGQVTAATLRLEFLRDPALPMLVGNDAFLRGIRLGIEQGLYVYQRGDLLVGKGDPPANIEIDEQSLILTAEYAADRQIWPRPAVSHSQPPGGAPYEKPGETAKPGEIADRPTTTITPPPAANAIRIENSMKPALLQAFEMAQQRGWATVATLVIRPFDPQDILRALTLINSVPNADKRLDLSIEIETAAGSAMTIHYNGITEDALPLKDFADPQMRAARDRTLSAAYRIQFQPPLPAKVESIHGLAERLGRIAPGSAEVTLNPADHHEIPA